MNNLSNTAKKLDKVFEIAHIVLGALAIGFIVCVALIAIAYVLKLDPSMIGTAYENFDIGFLELTIAENYAPGKWLVLLQTAISLLVGCRLMYEGRRGVGYIREILKRPSPLSLWTMSAVCATIPPWPSGAATMRWKNSWTRVNGSHPCVRRLTILRCMSTSFPRS